MATEIERKFLPIDDSWRKDVSHAQAMRQGYLGGENCSVRVRIAGDEAALNIKSLSIGISRSEFEYAIPVADAQALLALATGPLVEKTRHYLEFEGHLWEIDEFSGDNAGLVVAEIELDSLDATFVRPAWLGREVTDDARYYNLNLMREPYSRWSAR